MAVQALILAAGCGSRLGRDARGIPKALLEVGRKPLVEHQLEMLSLAGIGPVGMVVGYAADEIQRVLGTQVEYFHNDRWMTTNSLYSFALARNWVKGDLVVLNCDVLADPEILDRLIARGGSCLAYDSSSGSGREQMKVSLNGQRVVRIDKSLAAVDAHGENVGILHLRKECADALFQAAAQLLAAGSEKCWMATAVERIASDHVIEGVDVAGLPWGEVDFSYDLERARREVWPAIERRRRQRRPMWRLVRWAAMAGVVSLGAAFVAQSLFAPSANWEDLALSGGALSRVEIRGAPQNWYLLSAGSEEVRTEVVGPGEFRVESRLVLSDDAGDVGRYVLATALGDAAFAWHSLTTKPSGSAKHEDWTIGKNEWVTVSVPEGRHVLRARLELPHEGSCLLRVRQLVQTPEQ